jgi:hypothetical protein
MNGASEENCPLPAENAGLEAAAARTKPPPLRAGHLRNGCRLVIMHTQFTQPIFPTLTTASIRRGFLHGWIGRTRQRFQSVVRNHSLAVRALTLAHGNWYKPAERNQSVHSK